MSNYTLDRRTFLASLAAGAVVLPNMAWGAPARIVSVGGSITETIYFLKREALLVGADTTSVYPKAAERLPKVGYMRNLSVEGVLSLDPTMILLEEGAGPPVAVDSLKSVGVRIEEIAEARSIDDVVEKIRHIARLVDAAKEGEALANTVAERAQTIGKFVDTTKERPRVLFLLDVKDGSLMTAGRNTSVEAIVGLSGGKMVFDEFEGFRPITAEAVQHADPDVILLMSHVTDRLGGDDAVAKLPVLAPLRAARDGRIIGINGLLLLGFGPRTPDAVQLLARKLHGADQIPAAFDPLQPG
ncbi:heme/hemin ABC transporter substrate-binding protein [Hwanghaeella sp.]|uniref:heme/hemin ABC transporter substrate-binding protein n=1 Tax=Hwanghaeella sp. TaxID=2605943 RepID=UPI003CCC0F51